MHSEIRTTLDGAKSGSKFDPSVIMIYDCVHLEFEQYLAKMCLVHAANNYRSASSMNRSDHQIETVPGITSRSCVAGKYNSCLSNVYILTPQYSGRDCSTAEQRSSRSACFPKLYTAWHGMVKFLE